MVSPRRLPPWLLAAALAITVAIAPTAASGTNGARGETAAPSHRIDASEAPAAIRLAARTAPEERHDRVRLHLTLWNAGAAALAVVLLALAWSGSAYRGGRRSLERWTRLARGPPNALLLP